MRRIQSKDWIYIKSLGITSEVLRRGGNQIIFFNQFTETYDTVLENDCIKEDLKDEN